MLLKNGEVALVNGLFSEDGQVIGYGLAWLGLAC
jgi:hypothetical protein